MAQTPAGLKKCQALFLGPFIKYDNNVSNGRKKKRIPCHGTAPPKNSDMLGNNA